MHEYVAEKYKVTQLLKVGPGEGRGGKSLFGIGLESSEYTISPLSVLKRVSFCTGSLLASVCLLSTGYEMNNFCVNQGRGLKVSAAQLYPEFL